MKLTALDNVYNQKSHIPLKIYFVAENKTDKKHKKYNQALITITIMTTIQRLTERSLSQPRYHTPVRMSEVQQ